MEPDLITATGRHARYMELALKVAMHSPWHSRFRLGCVIVQNGMTVSVGWNDSHKTHPRAAHYKLQGLHAELAALVGVDSELLRGSTAYVARSRRITRTGMAKPCALCLHELRKSGVYKVYYSTNNDLVGMLRL